MKKTLLKCLSVIAIALTTSATFAENTVDYNIQVISQMNTQLQNPFGNPNSTSRLDTDIFVINFVENNQIKLTITAPPQQQSNTAATPIEYRSTAWISKDGLAINPVVTLYTSKDVPFFTQIVPHRSIISVYGLKQSDVIVFNKDHA